MTRYQSGVFAARPAASITMPSAGAIRWSSRRQPSGVTVSLKPVPRAFQPYPTDASARAIVQQFRRKIPTAVPFLACCQPPARPADKVAARGDPLGWARTHILKETMRTAVVSILSAHYENGRWPALLMRSAGAVAWTRRSPDWPGVPRSEVLAEECTGSYSAMDAALWLVTVTCCFALGCSGVRSQLNDEEAEQVMRISDQPRRHSSSAAADMADGRN